jgi:hypothetical protein
MRGLLWLKICFLIISIVLTFCDPALQVEIMAYFRDFLRVYALLKSEARNH